MTLAIRNAVITISLFAIATIGFLGIPSRAAAFSGDLYVNPDNFFFGADEYIQGRTFRIYARIFSSSERDIKGVVRFFDGTTQISGDQPISIVGASSDAVFADFTPQSAGTHTVSAEIFPFDEDDDDPSNNRLEKTIIVKADLDRDGVPDERDDDDDNDGVPDETDAFPLNRNESLDTDGDGTGDNADDDDDNDGVPDETDAFPRDPNESTDTDADGVGNNIDGDDDNDGIEDFAEVAAGLNPVAADSDSDGAIDGSDIFPQDPLEHEDFDGDGSGDNADDDDDNDGVLDLADPDDHNQGPSVRVVKSPLFSTADGTTTLNAEGSTDPDGSIEEITWIVDGKPYELGFNMTSVNLLFDKSGDHEVAIMVTDDKGESRERTVKIRVYNLQSALQNAFFLLAILLAIVLAGLYSRRSLAQKAVRTKKKRL